MAEDGGFRFEFSSSPIYSINNKYLNTDNPFFMSLQMPNSFLRELKIIKDSNKDMTLVDILNTQLTHMQLLNNQRVEQRLNCQSSTVFNNLRTKYSGGRKRKEYGFRLYTMALYKDEVKAIAEKKNFFTKKSEEICEEVWCYIEPERIKTVENKPFDDLGPQKKKKQKEEISEQSKLVLEFLEKYGLKPLVLTVSSESNNLHEIKLDGSSTKPHDNRSSLRTVVSILDRFGVSEEAYHELSQVFKDLPRTHSVTKARKEMSSEVVIERVNHGARVSFKAELTERVKGALKSNSDMTKVTVHLSSDGTKVSRIKSFVIFSFQLVGFKTKKRSSDLCTLAILNCKEDYLKFKDSLQELFDEINSVIDDGYIDVDDKKVEVKMVFCADMKMILTVLGLNSATSIHSCPWCLVSRNERHVIKPEGFYTTDEMMRTRINIAEHAESKEYGARNPPLLNLQVNDYVLDELHLLLRITDVLLNNLVDEALKSSTNIFGNIFSVKTLAEIMKKSGVTFKIWEDRETKKTNWTPLTGKDRKVLLEKLPENLKGQLNQETEARTLFLWATFQEIHQAMSSSGEADPCDLFAKSKTWVETFLSLGPSSKNPVTPYMHCMVYHLPSMVAQHGTLRNFSCQSVEKANDDIKKIYQRKANKWDPELEVLTIRKRMEGNSDLMREKRSYRKRKTDYWDTGLKHTRQEKRAKIKAKCLPSEPTPSASEDLHSA